MNSTPSSSQGETGSKPAEPDFMLLFCEQNGCPPADFEEQAFRMCLYWRARILAPVIRAFWPRYFDRDFALIRYLAKCQGRRNALNELAAFMDENSANGGFSRKLLRIRISARKASAVVGRVFEQHAASAGGGKGRTG